jgi:hypothetical protein
MHGVILEAYIQEHNMAINSIDSFKSAVMSHGGLANANRFNVIFNTATMSLLNLDPTN